MPIFSTSELGPPPAWRKVLWLRQPYPDNYTGEEFLDALVINADVVERGYWRVVRASLAVDLQLSAAAIVGSTAYKMHTVSHCQHLWGAFRGESWLGVQKKWHFQGGSLFLQGSLQAERVLAAAAALLLVGSLMQTVAAPAKVLKPGPASAGKRRWLWIQAAARRVVRSLASALLLLAVAAALSPVYATLTESISTDTVIACTCALLIAHLYLHDYSHSAAHASGRLSGSLGLTCALCASVLMASQLDAWQQVFALVSHLKSNNWSMAFSSCNAGQEIVCPLCNQGRRDVGAHFFRFFKRHSLSCRWCCRWSST